MGKAITKIIYKPDTQSSDEYLIIVNPEEVRHTLNYTIQSPSFSDLVVQEVQGWRRVFSLSLR